MSLCASCGLALVTGELCPHHHEVSGDDWAASNRIVCDLVHRHKDPARLSCTDREEYPYGGIA